MTATATAEAQRPPASVDDLADRIDGAVREALRIPAFDAARAAANEAGLVHAKSGLAESVDRLEKLQAAYRDSQAAERRAKDTYESALVEAEWSLDSRFVTEGTKTYLVLDEPEAVNVGTPSDPDASVPGGDKARKQMTAAERTAWKKTEATKQPAVRDALTALHDAEGERQAAADAVGLEERRFTACRLELEASIAQLSALTTALGRTA